MYGKKICDLFVVRTFHNNNAGWPRESELMRRIVMHCSNQIKPNLGLPTDLCHYFMSTENLKLDFIKCQKSKERIEVGKLVYQYVNSPYIIHTKENVW